MSISVRTAAWLVLLAPACALAAMTAQQQRAEVLDRSPDLVHGAALFVQCTSCHGADGGGESNGSTPNIAGQHFRVLVKQLVDFRYGNRRDSRMESMADRHHLTDAQDIADVAAFVSGLTRPDIRGIGSGEFAAEGERIYTAQCASCHGVGAQGTDDGVPRLAGQHYGYLMRQMYDSVDGRRPAWTRLHSKRLAPLEYQQIRAVADYLARVGWVQP